MLGAATRNPTYDECNSVLMIYSEIFGSFWGGGFGQGLFGGLGEIGDRG